MTFLPDIDVLLPLFHERHTHHKVAARWLNAVPAGGTAIVCRLSQMGVMRLVSTPTIMGLDLMSAGFWGDWARMMDDDRFLFELEPPGFYRAWRNLTSALPKASCAGTDAYFAAMAMAGGWKLVTFDGGYRRFKGLDLEVLSPA